MTLHPYDQHDWRKESLTCELDELEHVLQAHIENDVAIEAVLRLPPQTVAEILLSLRADMHREQVQSMEEWEEQDLIANQKHIDETRYPEYANMSRGMLENVLKHMHQRAVSADNGINALRNEINALNKQIDELKGGSIE